MTKKIMIIPVNAIPKKIYRIYELNKAQAKKNKKWWIRSALAIPVFLGMLTSLFWVSKTISQILVITLFIPILWGLLGLVKVVTLSFEKDMFMKLFRAYKFFERFNSLKGSSSQDPSDLKNAKKLLTAVSVRLMSKKIGGRSTLDLAKELYEKYGELGELIQTKVLYLIEKGEKAGLVGETILYLLKLFSEPKMGALDSCITFINAIPETGPFKPKKIFLENNPRIRSWGSHIGKLIVSGVVVVIVASFYAHFFSTPFSELTTSAILASTFVLYVAWEFTSARA